MRRPLPVAAAALAVAVLAACGQDAAPAEDLSWEDSPLSKALADLYGGDLSPEEQEREMAEREREVQEIIATCMAEQGFEYIPVTFDDSFVVWDEDDDWGSPEWAEQYGYGITTDPWADEQPQEPVEEWADPNDDYVMAMSPAEQEAYFEALHGPMEEFEDDGEWVEDVDVEYSWEDAGCYGLAQHEVYDQGNEQDMWEDPAFSELFAAAERLYDDVQRDPEVAEINDEWAACMADAGFDGMTAPEDAAAPLYEEWERLYTEAETQIDWENLDWDAMGPNTDPVRDLIGEDVIAELREREIATAVADSTCQAELGTQSRYLAVQFEHEEKFLETWQSDIEALVAIYGQES